MVDADALAREALAPGTDGFTDVIAQFGRDVLAPDGSLDRAALGRVVFADQERLAALNAIKHPYVGRRSAEMIAAAPDDAVVVFDVPLLVENHLEAAYDAVVVVDASEETRLDRLAAARGMSEGEAGRDGVTGDAGGTPGRGGRDHRQRRRPRDARGPGRRGRCRRRHLGCY